MLQFLLFFCLGSNVDSSPPEPDTNVNTGLGLTFKQPNGSELQITGVPHTCAQVLLHEWLSTTCKIESPENSQYVVTPKSAPSSCGSQSVNSGYTGDESSNTSKGSSVEKTPSPSDDDDSTSTSPTLGGKEGYPDEIPPLTLNQSRTDLEGNDIPEGYEQWDSTAVKPGASFYVSCLGSFAQGLQKFEKKTIVLCDCHNTTFATNTQGQIAAKLLQENMEIDASQRSSVRAVFEPYKLSPGITELYNSRGCKVVFISACTETEGPIIQKELNTKLGQEKVPFFRYPKDAPEKKHAQALKKLKEITGLDQTAIDGSFVFCIDDCEEELPKECPSNVYRILYRPDSVQSAA